MTIDWSQLKTAEQKTAEAFTTALAAKYAENNSLYEQTSGLVTAGYPQLEKDTWPTQDKEVKAWQADPANAVTPWIDAAAAVRGIDREEYLQRTLTKTQQFEQISAYLTGLRQKYEDQIKQAKTVEQLNVIELVYQLPGAIA